MESPTEANISTSQTSFFINRNFGLLWVGGAVSELGDWTCWITLSLWIATGIANGQSWAPLSISGVMLASFFPKMLFGPFAGVYADRWNKRHTMMLMDVLRALLMFLLLPLTGLLPLPFLTRPYPALWQLGSIYVVVMLSSICSQFFDPSRFTILSEILSERQRGQAAAREQTTSNLLKIIGPFLGAPLIFAFGIQWAILINALSFLISWGMIFQVRTPKLEKTASKDAAVNNFWGEMREGLAFYKESRIMLTILISLFILVLGSGGLDALLIFFFQKNLHAPTGWYGSIPMAVGAGSVIGALSAGYLIKRMGSTRLFWLSLLLIGIILLLFARQTILWPALIILLLAGLPIGTLNTSVGPILMHIIPHDLMGRVMSVFSTAQTIGMLLSISLSGLLGTLLAGLHTTILGVTFTTYDTIYLGLGTIFTLAGVYAMVNLRGLKVDG